MRRQLDAPTPTHTQHAHDMAHGTILNHGDCSRAGALLLPNGSGRFALAWPL
jgi:hypothetical protein